MRIAICLSGQPRSIEFASRSILHHFNNDGADHTYDFFCHVWDYNTWKLQDITYTSKELVDKIWLIDQLKKFSPKYYIIESMGAEIKTYNKDLPYGSLLYSAMRANHLKKRFEMENNFRYDYVFKVRYDNIFYPNIPQILPNTMQHKTLFFPHLSRMPLEYNRFNATDCVYYGDSWAMDIAADLYRHVARIIEEVHREDDFECFGPGTLMADYANSMHIDLQQCHRTHEIIYRKEVLGLDPLSIEEFNIIYDMHGSFYKEKKF